MLVYVGKWYFWAENAILGGNCVSVVENAQSGESVFYGILWDYHTSKILRNTQKR